MFEGYQHYISAAIMLIFAIGGMIDPKAVDAVVTFFGQLGISVSGPTILMICGLVVVGLKKLQKRCETQEQPKAK